MSLSPRYAELHCITNYSFLRGASHPHELVSQAAVLGYSAIAITDECSMAGVVKAYMAAGDCGIKLIIGSEFQLDDGVHLVLLATNRVSYGQICNLITVGRRRTEKGEYRLSMQDLTYGFDQCLAIWLPKVANATVRDTSAIGCKLKQWFRERLWLGVEIFPDGHDIACYEQAFELSKQLGIPMTATGDVHMHHPDRKPLQDVVSAVRMGQSVRLAGKLLYANREKYLRPLSVLARLYPPALLEESARIADLCRFSLSELRYEYPQELVPPHLSPSQYLRQLVEAGVKKRWPEGESCETRALIEKELGLIAGLGYEFYFLTVFDIVQFAKSEGILCQGRGSAANSAVCFCLEITEVDPVKISLLFERFISKERNEPPDIDVDFEHERREEVIQYIYKKYGRHRAAIAATVITYRPKSAVRDVGKALGMDSQLIDHLARSLSWWDKREELLARFEEAGINPRNPVIARFITLVQQILGFPRHLSQHVGGFVISSGPLSYLVPLENAAMKDRTIIQWDKDDLESLGLLKVDVLALGMLTAIRKSLALVNAYRNTDLSLSSIPPEDAETYQMLQKGDSIGVFQVESRAQISMLPRLKPKNFYDLVIEVAIVRPGPIQGNMVHPYLKRRNGEETVTYANDAVRSVLERTLGVPIFQEQVIKLAVVAAGFTPGEADQLRRAMAAWKRRGGLEGFQQKLIDGMLVRGHEREFAERIFEQIKGFGDYGFPESHSASFALLVYFSAWLKRHEPAAFYCGLLNSQPMGFYSPSQLVQDARRHRIEVRPVDVFQSEWESTLEVARDAGASQPSIRLGFNRIKGLKFDTALRIIHARNDSPPQSIH
ncbi:MAG: error-prone DNA polymerase, partial [Pseudomonadales bacterium]